MTKNFLLGLLVLLIFISCSASTNAQRFKKESKPKAASVPPNKTPADPAKKKDEKPVRVVYEDPADSSSADDEFDEPPPAENPVDKSKFALNIEKLKDFNISLTTREKILFESIKFLDTPYKYGGNTQNGIDCSAFTRQVYGNALNIELPRSAREQFTAGDKIPKDELQFGDLVFFNTRVKSNPGHVGIYLGENQFVHASRSLGVTVSSLENPYYKKRYAGARRIDRIEE